jgi:very-short-patch-repair endonuclease
VPASFYLHHVRKAYNYYNPNLKQKARSLRGRPTLAEDILWQDILRNGKLMDWKFTRQRPVAHYIADFMCVKLRLIIEVDGLTHQWEASRDAERDQVLQRLGFRVLRFTDEQVMRDRYNVVRTIETVVEELAQGRHPLNPPRNRKGQRKGEAGPS